MDHVGRALMIALLVVTWHTAAVAQQRPPMLPPDWTRDSAPDDPLRYRSPDGTAWVSLFASHARDPSREARSFGTPRQGERVTYNRKTKRFVAIAGYVEDRIFYRKSNLACGQSRWHHIAMEYPAEDKRKMDDLVTRIAHGMNRYDGDCRDPANSASTGRGSRR